MFGGRLWRSVRYERMYLKAYDCVSAAKADIEHNLNLYWPHGRLSHAR